VGVGNVTSYLDIDRGTPARQESKGQSLPRHAAEGVLRLLDIERMAYDTFEEGDFTQWLNRPHPMLDGETPLQAAETSYGAEQVKSILVAIKHGDAV
jgi:putative toxin-antitoxin system antitoxin component (TIGR02293 family)